MCGWPCDGHGAWGGCAEAQSKATKWPEEALPASSPPVLPSAMDGGATAYVRMASARGFLMNSTSVGDWACSAQTALEDGAISWSIDP